MWLIGEPVTVSIFSLFPFLPCPASEPPGMIINLIIKHLLPTAPALSLSPVDPRDPITREGREREEEESGREREGIQEEPEGGVGESRTANPKGVIITLPDSFTPARGSFFVWQQAACEVM